MGLNMIEAPTGTTIPPGWRRLMHGEIAGRKDYCRTERSGKEWARVSGIYGDTIMENNLSRHGDYIVIRHEPTKPAPQKEWMNPWD
jgi:hypothetical protein